MSIIETVVASKLGAVALGAAGGGLAALGLLAAKLYLPKLAGKYAGDFIAHAMNPKTEDLRERELQAAAVLALVRLAEYKYPDAGKGARRFAYVSDFLRRWMPEAKAETIRKIIEDAVQAMDSKAKEVLAEHPEKNP